jgi:hypothetical protein
LRPSLLSEPDFLDGKDSGREYKKTINSNPAQRLRKKWNNQAEKWRKEGLGGWPTFFLN